MGGAGVPVASLAGQARVELVEFLRDDVEALTPPGIGRSPRPGRVEPRRPRAARRLRLCVAGRSLPRSRLLRRLPEREPLSPSGAGTKIDALPRIAALWSGRRTRRTCVRLRTVRGIEGRNPRGFVCRSMSSQSGRSRSSAAIARVTLLPASSSSTAITGRFSCGGERRIDADGHERVVAFEALCRCVRGLPRRREESVDASAEPVTA